MPKVIKLPKYKKGYTWGHYLDEWWDRAGTEFKVKLFCFVVIGLLVSAAGIVFLVSQRMERESFMEIAKEAKIKPAVSQDPTRIELHGDSLSAWAQIRGACHSFLRFEQFWPSHGGSEPPHLRA